ncbi:hypothetical protein FGG08_005488 [Glutinoglossum americanum]|uniref:Heterokaryon incompatibility domain-containing protein n=1 Tax=Glutinoglossum americanum TaxID=1670608 RepID=A0A9P8I9D2_9PEZI|nr:hypothetical protein FGG08_005488 [Glutinoglossum americanum]
MTSHVILCSGAKIRVTQSLHTALLQQCYPDCSRTIWVDVICINQEDIPERNTQVQLMRGIYASATTVIVSFGEVSSDMDLALNLAHDLADAYAKRCKMHTQDSQKQYGSEYHGTHLLLDLRKEVSLTEEGSAETMIDFHDTAAWSALRDLFQRPWFTRAYLRECAGISSFQDVKIADYMAVLSASLRNFGDQEHRSPLVEALTAARSLGATDPQDKICSLLGIIDKQQEDSLSGCQTGATRFLVWFWDA